MCICRAEIVDMSRILAGRGEVEGALLLLRFVSQLPVQPKTEHVTRVGDVLFKHMAKSDV